jgi:hypothetical protein
VRPPARIHATISDYVKAAFGAQIKSLRSLAWVIYAKRPFAGPGQVLDYLGRYTHRVAIANSRLLACENGRVTFRWKDYRARHQSKAMTLEAAEFIRRFLLHVLPTGFRRIRHVGFLANACRSAKLARLRTALDVAAPPAPVKPKDYRERSALLTGRRIDQCPRCGGRMVDIAHPLPRCRRPSDPFLRCDTS